MPKYKKIYVHVAENTWDEKNKPMIMPVKEVKRRLEAIFKHFPKVEVISGEGFRTRTNFDDLPKFDVVICGEKDFPEKAKKFGIKVRVFERTPGYSGTIYRRGLKRTVKKVRKIVRKKMEQLKDTSHAFDHIQRVYKIAVYLAKQEKADVEIVQLGSLLHDIGRIEGEPHAALGARITDEILKEIDYPQKRRKLVSRIVRFHGLEDREKLKTMEEKVVWDADKIDLIGMFGIVRIFHFYGNFMAFDRALKRWFKVRQDAYKLLFTKTAKKLAKKRYKKTLQFSSNLRKEMCMEDLKFESYNTSRC